MLRSRIVTPLVELLRRGITPEKLAISSALGFMLGSRPFAKSENPAAMPSALAACNTAACKLRRALDSVSTTLLVVVQASFLSRARHPPCV